MANSAGIKERGPTARAECQLVQGKRRPYCHFWSRTLLYDETITHNSHSPNTYLFETSQTWRCRVSKNTKIASIQWDREQQAIYRKPGYDSHECVGQQFKSILVSNSESSPSATSVKVTEADGCCNGGAFNYKVVPSSVTKGCCPSLARKRM